MLAIGFIKKRVNFLARFSFSSTLNTLIGMAAFPVVYSLAPDLGIFLCILVSYLLSILFSFATHAKITYRVKLRARQLWMFASLQLVALISNYLILLIVSKGEFLDIRILQPGIAVTMQLILVYFYSKIFR